VSVGHNASENPAGIETVENLMRYVETVMVSVRIVMEDHSTMAKLILV